MTQIKSIKDIIDMLSMENDEFREKITKENLISIEKQKDIKNVVDFHTKAYGAELHALATVAFLHLTMAGIIKKPDTEDDFKEVMHQIMAITSTAFSRGYIAKEEENKKTAS